MLAGPLAHPATKPPLLQIADPIAAPTLTPGYNKTKKLGLFKQKSRTVITMLKVANVLQSAAKPVVGRSTSWVTRENLSLVDVFLQFDTDNANSLDASKLRAMHTFYGEDYDEAEVASLIARLSDDRRVDYATFLLLVRHWQRAGKFAKRFEEVTADAVADAEASRRKALLDDLMSRADGATRVERKKARRRPTTPVGDQQWLSGVRTGVSAEKSGVNWALLGEVVSQATEERKVVVAKPAPSPPKKRGRRARVVPV